LKSNAEIKKFAIFYIIYQKPENRSGFPN